jgi:hypothetical protein
MKTVKKQKRMVVGEDYIKIQKKLNRELELERNGGRWIAVDRPWKNNKKYDRKRDKKVNLNDSCLFSLCSHFNF